jgi:chaperonin GroES
MSSLDPAKEVVILKDPGKQTTKSGLFIPQPEGKERPEIGEVVAIGKGIKPVAFEVGDRIVYRKYIEHSVQVGANHFIIVEFKDIRARVID